MTSTRAEKLIGLGMIMVASMWLAATVIIDFFVVPAVFKMIDQFFLAGDLGLALFSKFNRIELFLGTTLVSLAAMQLRKDKTWLMIFIVSLFVWMLAMLYLFSLSPKIGELTELWKTADSFGITGIAGIADIQQEHHWYHRLYIILDGIKLLILAALITLVSWRESR